MLTGTYGLLGEQMDFHGTAQMDAKLSEATTGVKSFLLKAVDRFFEKPGAGNGDSVPHRRNTRLVRIQCCLTFWNRT